MRNQRKTSDQLFPKRLGSLMAMRTSLQSILVRSSHRDQSLKDVTTEIANISGVSLAIKVTFAELISRALSLLR